MDAVKLWIAITAKRLAWIVLAVTLITSGAFVARRFDLSVSRVASAAQSFVWSDNSVKPATSAMEPVVPSAAGAASSPITANTAPPADATSGEMVTTSTVEAVAGHRAPGLSTSRETVLVANPGAPRPPPLPLHLDRESTCLARAIYHEAAHDPFEVRVAIAHVAVQRLAQAGQQGSALPGGKSTLCSIVYHGLNSTYGCLFVATCRHAGAPEPSGEAWRQAQKIADDLLAGRLHAADAAKQPLLVTATHFHAATERPAWLGQVVKLAQIGRFVFSSRKPTEPADEADLAPNRAAPATLAVRASRTETPGKAPSATRRPSVREAGDIGKTRSKARDSIDPWPSASQ